MIAAAPEHAETQIRQGQRPNDSRDPSLAAYLALKARDFVDYRLTVDRLVQSPLSLAELHNRPSRTQITRHDCVEDWGPIAKWTGTPLSLLLDLAKVLPAARFVLFHCFDDLGNSRSGPVPYYESCDLIDARHPQTITAYGLNGRVLPVANGAPLRIRVERAPGYKQPKYATESNGSAVLPNRGAARADIGRTGVTIGSAESGQEHLTIVLSAVLRRCPMQPENLPPDQRHRQAIVASVNSRLLT